MATPKKLSGQARLFEPPPIVLGKRDRGGLKKWRERGYDSRAEMAEKVVEVIRPRSERDPYYLDEPTLISFSGGRTSAYLLWRVREAHGGRLPDNVCVTFQNTGMERTETLDFVHRIEVEWGVDVVWLEYTPPPEWGMAPKFRGWRRVTYETAFRLDEPAERPDGTMRPFDALLKTMAAYRKKEKNADPLLPNPVQRLCTSYLKVKTQARYVEEALGWDDYLVVMGLRYDEPTRVANLTLSGIDAGEPYFPLAIDKVSEGDVLAFWKVAPFDLGLESGEGNCSLCHLKSIPKTLRLLRARPQDAPWWIEQERWTGQTFRRDRPNYAAMLEKAQSLPPERIEEMEASGAFPDTLPCTCTD